MRHEAGEKNLLFKGISEKRSENCFDDVRCFIRDNLGIERDMYLERAHRLGRFVSGKTRPIIVAFRDFCDTLEILDASPSLRGSDYGVSRDYPSEISKARQSLWPQYKLAREANRNKKVAMEYPAKICVNGVVVADAFPDWYPILNGSRVSCDPKTQSSDQNVNSNVDSGSSETGLASGTVGSRDVPPMNLPMGQSTGSVSHTRAHIQENNSQLTTQRDEGSQEPMEEDVPPSQGSPSLLGNARPPSSNVKQAEATPEPNTSQRGRSPTRKTGVNGRRPQSASRSVTRGKSQGAPRSKSKASKHKGQPDSNQSTGNANFKTPSTKPNKTDRDKVETLTQSAVPGEGSPV